MAESASYWICSCGKSNLKINRKCTGCSKHRPRRWLIIGAALIAAVVGIAVLAPDPHLPETSSTIPAAQQEFLSEIRAFQAQVILSPNSLALQELIQSRDTKIANMASLEGWSGIVLGVQSVQGKGGISIDIGGVNLLAGVHLARDLDTLIPSSQTTVYNTLLNLRRGDKVILSGDFEDDNGSAVEMSYTSHAGASNPEFLFNFKALDLE